MRALFPLLALPLAACGSDRPPPLTGNLTDARGAHAGSFRGADGASPGDYGNAARAAEAGGANMQDQTR